MNVFGPLVATRLIIALGIVNLVTGALVFFFLSLSSRVAVGQEANEISWISTFLQIPLLYLDGLRAFCDSTRHSGADILWLAKIGLE